MLPEWLDKGYVREILTPEPLFFSRMFTVPKPEKGVFRPIIDLSVLNTFLVVPKFRMDTMAKIVRSICPGMWGTKIDLDNAYYSVIMAPEFHKYLAFSLGHRVFVFQVLPFGLATAPWAFTRVLRPIKKQLHLEGICMSHYLDDFIVLAFSQVLAVSHTRRTTEFLQSMGFTINWRKSALLPCQRLTFLGVCLDLKQMQLSLPPEKASRILEICKSLPTRQQASRRELEAIAGFLNFASSYVPLGRLYLLPFLKWMNKHTLVSTRDIPVPVDQELLRTLQPWDNPDLLQAPVPMHVDRPDLVVMTDASEWGWCGILLPHRVEGVWPQSVASHSMNWKELETIRLSLLHFRPLIAGKTIKVLSDNTTALACLKHQGSLASTHLWFLSKIILEDCLKWNIVIVPSHIQGVLNVLADQGSREHPISTEWMIDRETFLLLCRVLGTPQIELFATRENNHLPQFVSPCPDNLAIAVDALACDWNLWGSLYLFPPIPKIQDVALKLQNFPGSGWLIAPYWTGAPWFPYLRHRCQKVLPLPPHHFLLQETARGTVFMEPQSLEVLNLHAWVL